MKSLATRPTAPSEPWRELLGELLSGTGILGFESVKSIDAALDSPFRYSGGRHRCIGGTVICGFALIHGSRVEMLHSLVSASDAVIAFRPIRNRSQAT